MALAPPAAASTPLTQLPVAEEEDDPTVQEVLQELNSDLPQDEEFYVQEGPTTPPPPPAGLLGALDAFVGDAKLIGLVAVSYIITEFTPIGFFISKYLAAVENIPHSALVLKALFTALLSFALYRIFIAPRSSSS
jgi:hypothetical protein